MDNLKYNILTQKQTRRPNLSQNKSWQSVPPLVPRRDFQDMLELLTHTDDLDMLEKIFSTLGLSLLTKNTIIYERAIKYDELYKKLALVLKSGFQSKSIIALNLISALLCLDNENELTKRKSLHILAKNMIRVSGCLTAMTELFTSSMMCIQKCKRGIMDPISILQSLLSDHEGNVKLFYESKGMTMFDRESLWNPACLQLLNLVVENTKPEYRDEILKASDLFHQLRSYINKYGRNSMIGQWASVILFSHCKVVNSEIVNEEEYTDIFKPKINKTLLNSINETQDVNDTINETEELLRKALSEAIGWQNQFGNKNKIKHDFNGSYRNNNIQKKSAGMPYSYVNTHRPNRNKKAECEENDIFRFAVETETENDLSFAFLLKESPSEPRYSYKAYEKYKTGRNDATMTEFKPHFVSTPKGSKHTNDKRTTRTSTKSLICSTTRDHNICNKKLNNRSKFTKIIMTNKGSRNRSMSAKFLDIVNGSCTTLIKRFKSMFTTKKSSDNSLGESKDPVRTNLEENNSCVSSFTNYVHRRDGTVSKEKRDQDWTNFTKKFSMENSYSNSCNTCNDTIVLKHKLENDVFLQQTVRRLKLGINLYGCDFKKISRTIWPREMYMTPNVLYNLYRKLIIKQ